MNPLYGLHKSKMLLEKTQNLKIRAGFLVEKLFTDRGKNAHTQKTNTEES